MTITPTHEQAEAIQSIIDWYRHTDGNTHFLLDGGAGTGKTTVAGIAIKALGLKNPMFGAYTAKAARVMALKGMDGARTIHSHIYRSYTIDGVTKWELSLSPHNALWGASILVVDECSMVSEQVADDLARFRVPTLVLGDVDGQLPPIKGTGAFYKSKPDFRLTEPHRSALDSNINRIAWIARRGGTIRRDMGDGEQVIIKSMMDPTAWDHITDMENIVICGKHKTRYAATRRCRERLGYSGSVPLPGEPIICCRNDYDRGLINGSIATVWRIAENKPHLPYFHADLIIEGEDVGGVKIDRGLFLAHPTSDNLNPHVRPEGAQFDWAYAITCHKAQGSEWPSVCVIDDQFMKWDADQRRRWLYTAVTRASEKLIILQTTK